MEKEKIHSLQFRTMKKGYSTYVRYYMSMYTILLFHGLKPVFIILEDIEIKK